MEKDQILRKIKIWLLGIWDIIADFFKGLWEGRQILCVSIIGVLLLAIALLITIPSVKSSQAKAAKRNETSPIQEVEIEPFLSIPQEPYIEDDYVYTRKNVTRWSDESVGEWFSEPDADMLDDLKKANDKLVEDMMEVVP